MVEALEDNDCSVDDGDGGGDNVLAEVRESLLVG